MNECKENVILALSSWKQMILQVLANNSFMLLKALNDSIANVMGVRMYLSWYLVSINMYNFVLIGCIKKKVDIGWHGQVLQKS